MVDDEDYARLSAHKWHALKTHGGNRAYRHCKNSDGIDYKRKHILMHREVMGLAINDPRVVDHKNHNQLDNRKENLRVCNVAQNSYNCLRRSDNSSGFKGVSFHKKRNKYQAYIHKGKYIHLGSFDNPIDAARKYNEAAKELFGEYALLNNIPEVNYGS